LLPTHGCNEWDRAGGPLSDPDGLAAFVDETQKTIPENVTLINLDCHINDPEFCERALAIFDQWVSAGVIRS
jgi:uncharacterized protein (UPF0261 family)